MKSKVLSIIGSALIALGLIVIFAGCAGPNAKLSPAIVQQGVATGVAYSVVRYPTAVPYLKQATPFVCAAASSTNLSPAWIVSVIEGDPMAEKLKTPEGVLILNGALLLYTGIWESYGTNAPAVPEEVQPYLQATCDGLHQGLAFTSVTSRKKAAVGWPRVKF